MPLASFCPAIMIIYNRHIFQQQPFILLPLIAYCVGIATHTSFSSVHTTIIITGTIILLMCHAIANKIGYLLGGICLLMICAGAVRTQWKIDAYEHFFTTAHNISYKAQATVDDIQPLEQSRYRYQLTLTITKLAPQTDSSWQDTYKTIYWYCLQRPPCSIGDTIELSELTFKKPRKASFLLYLMKENIYSTFFSIRIPIISKAKNTSLLPHKTTLYATLVKKFSKNTGTLLGSLFFGAKTVKNKNTVATKKHFATWGLSHYLARSGLHLVLFIMVWETILKLLPLSYDIKIIIQILLSILYFLLSWPSVSFLRALWMFIIYKICLLWYLRPHLLHILLVVAFGVLLYNPLHLFFLDFQLSFLLTYALAWISRLSIRP